MPLEVLESSGAAFSGRRGDLLWTHNDDAPADIFAVDTAGTLIGRVSVTGATNRDWEDLARGPCADGGPCLYIADTGDNAERRETVTIYRVVEPDPAADATAPVEAFRIRFPEGPRDAEALAVTREGEVFIVNKGRSDPITLYRYPGPLRSGEVVTLEPVQPLLSTRPVLPDQVSSASFSADGHWLAVRNYHSVQLYRRAGEGFEAALPGAGVDLTSMREPQGEAVAFGPGGLLAFTSETVDSERGPLSLLSCSFEQ